jgi:uncharacterized protein YcnI
MKPTLTLGLALLATAQPALAHVSLQPQTAPPGAHRTLDFVVGHGCQGEPTTALRVEIPPGVTEAFPMAKDGWSLTTEPNAVIWRGVLDPRQHERFQVSLRLPDREGPLSFAAVQTCGASEVRWDEAPTPDGAKPAHPAPTLMLIRDAAPAPH